MPAANAPSILVAGTSHCSRPSPKRQKESTAHPGAKRCFPEGKEAWYCLSSTFRPSSAMTSYTLYAHTTYVFQLNAAGPHDLVSTEVSLELSFVNKIFYPLNRKSQHKMPSFTGHFAVFSTPRTRRHHRLRNLHRIGADFGNLGKVPYTASVATESR